MAELLRIDLDPLVHEAVSNQIDINKLNHISITEDINLDTIKNDTDANNVKETNVTTNLSIIKTDNSNTIVSSDGTNAIISESNETNAGLLSSANLTRLKNTESSSQLDSRDTTNRNRTNHTGSQSSSTISDFDSAVSANTDVLSNKSSRHNHDNKTILDNTTAIFTTTLETKMNGIETGATADQTDSEIEALYEGISNTNKYTDSDKTKLGNTETSTQLNNRDINNRDRANHTGTQTANTISNFDSAVKSSETTTSLSISANIMTYTDEDGGTTDIDLSLYLDDTNLARLTSGSLEANTGVVTFSRDDGSTFTIDMSALLDDTQVVVNDTLNSTSSAEALSAKQGKVVNDILTAHKANVGNPHNVNKSQVGLGNVDNTADADKPISTNMQTALDAKQGVLTEGAFADGDKTKLDSQSGTNTGDQTKEDIDALGINAAKVNSLTVETAVPANAVFTDTVYDDSTTLKDSDVGSTVQAYNANTVIDSSYVHTDNNYTTSEKSKLSGIEQNATADQTASEILVAIKTVDGEGSELDADKLDGMEPSELPINTATQTKLDEINARLDDGSW